MHIRKALYNNIFWKAVGLVFNFISNLLIVRILGVETSGGFYLTIAYLTLIITGMRFGLENGITYVTSKYPNATAGLVWFIIPFAIIQAEIVSFFLKFLPAGQQQFSVKMASLYVLTNILIYYITSFYQSKKMFSSVNFIVTLFVGIQTLVLAYVYYQLPAESSQRLSHIVFNTQAILGVLTIALLIAYYYNKNHADFTSFTVTSGIFLGIFKFSGLNFISTILFYLITRADFYFVEKFCNPNILGNYVQAAKFAQMALVLPGFFGGVIFPYAINSNASFAEKIVKMCRILTAILLITLTLLFLFGDFFFPWVLGSSFQQVSTAILLMFAGIYFASMNILLLSYFEGLNKQFIILIANLITLSLIIIFDKIFVPQYGYKAAAVIFSIANFAGFIILYFYFYVRTKISPLQLLRFSKNDLKSLLGKA